MNQKEKVKCNNNCANMDVRYYCQKKLVCRNAEAKVLPSVGDFVELFDVTYVVEQRKFYTDGEKVNIAVRRKNNSDYYMF